MLTPLGPESMKPLALVVDRDAGTRKLLDVLLTRFGYEVDRVVSSPDAVTLLQIVDYDFVLSDNEAVLRWIAEHRPEALERMMVLSSAPELQLQKMQREWSRVPIVRKPFELADVIEASRAAAANRPARTPTVNEVFCRQSVMAGAKSSIVVRLSGETVDLVNHYGYEPGAVERWFPLSLNDPYPICAAMKRSRAVWLASVTAGHNEYPLLAAVWQTYETRALATVPIVRRGQVIGAAGWTFRETQRFSESDQRVWTSLAESAAEFIKGDFASESTSQAGA